MKRNNEVPTLENVQVAARWMQEELILQGIKDPKVVGFQDNPEKDPNRFVPFIITMKHDDGSYNGLVFSPEISSTRPEDGLGNHPEVYRVSPDRLTENPSQHVVS